MFAIFRTFSDYEGDFKVLLFITDSKQKAEDYVTLAELEQEQALALPHPSGIYGEPKWLGKPKTDQFFEEFAKRKEQYREDLNSIMTLDPVKEVQSVDCQGYSWKEVEVR